MKMVAFNTVIVTQIYLNVTTAKKLMNVVVVE